MSEARQLNVMLCMAVKSSLDIAVSLNMNWQTSTFRKLSSHSLPLPSQYLVLYFLDTYPVIYLIVIPRAEYAFSWSAVCL